MTNKKGVYLAARGARHSNYNIVYNDIDPSFNCDLSCDMLSVDLSLYDFILATPPCNYYSRCNYRRDISNYALKTRHLLPSIIIKLAKLGKPFIVENVRNFELFKKCNIFDICDKYNVNVYFVGRHTYFTNVFVNLTCPQHFDFYNHGIKRYKGINTQGGENVFNCFEIWLEYIHSA